MTRISFRRAPDRGSRRPASHHPPALLGCAATLVTALSCSDPGEGAGASLPPAFAGNPPGASDGSRTGGNAAGSDGSSGSPSGDAIENGSGSGSSNGGGSGQPAAGAGEGNPSAFDGSGGASGAGANSDAAGSGGSAAGAAMTGSGSAGSAMSDDSTPGNPGAGGASMTDPEEPADEEPFAGRGCAADVALFCEDFETLNVGALQPTGGLRPDGAVSIDDQVARGSRAVHFQPGGGQASRIFLDNFSAPNNSFFGRVYAFVEQFATGPNYAHFVMVEVTGNGGERVRPLGGQYIQEVGGLSMWGVGSDGGATGDWTAWQETAPTENGTWTCLEWEMRAQDNAVNVWIDGVSKPELSVSTNDHTGNGNFVFPTFSSMWLGWWVFQGGTTPPQFNVWLDDIVLSTERVGCD